MTFKFVEVEGLYLLDCFQFNDNSYAILIQKLFFGQILMMDIVIAVIYVFMSNACWLENDFENINMFICLITKLDTTKG